MEVSRATAGRPHRGHVGLTGRSSRAIVRKHWETDACLVSRCPYSDRITRIHHLRQILREVIIGQILVVASSDFGPTGRICRGSAGTLFFIERTREMLPILKSALVWTFAALGAVWLASEGCDSPKPKPDAGASSASTGNGPAQLVGVPGVQNLGAPTAEDTGPHAAGKKVFRSLNCAVCHPLPGIDALPRMAATAAVATAGPPGADGVPPGRPQRPPSLARVGADPGHTVEWLIAQIRDPKSHNRESRMPAYDESRISNDDLKSLAEFLESLKGDGGGDADSRSDPDRGIEIRPPGS